MTCMLIGRFQGNLLAPTCILIVITLFESALFSALFDWTQVC